MKRKTEVDAELEIEGDESSSSSSSVSTKKKAKKLVEEVTVEGQDNGHCNEDSQRISQRSQESANSREKAVSISSSKREDEEDVVVKKPKKKAAPTPRKTPSKRGKKPSENDMMPDVISRLKSPAKENGSRNKKILVTSSPINTSSEAPAVTSSVTPLSDGSSTTSDEESLDLLYFLDMVLLGGSWFLFGMFAVWSAFMVVQPSLATTLEEKVFQVFDEAAKTHGNLFIVEITYFILTLLVFHFVLTGVMNLVEG